MRMIFDFIKDVLRKADGYWIESAGHPITVKGIHTRKPGKNSLYIEDVTFFTPLKHVLIYGFYDYPEQHQCSVFGIDAPDELTVQINEEIVRNKLGMVPAIGTLLQVENGDWVVTNTHYTYNHFIGKCRLSLLCNRFQESFTTGIHEKESVEVDEE